MVCLHRNRNPKKILFPKETISGMLSIHNFPDTSKAWFPWSPFSYFLFYFIKFCSFLPQKKEKKENIILGLTLFCSFEDQLHLSIHSMWNLWKKNYLNAFIFSAVLFYLLGSPLASTITKTLQLLSPRSHGTCWKLPLFLNSVVLPAIAPVFSLSQPFLTWFCLLLSLSCFLGQLFFVSPRLYRGGIT